jgi:hypothetical protein
MIRSALVAARPIGCTALAWLAQPSARPILLALAALVAGQAVFALYDIAVLGLPLVREEPAAFGAGRMAQSLFLLVVSAMLVAALVRARAKPSMLDTKSLGPGEIVAALVLMGGAAAATALFLADPSAFHAGAQEDRALEWMSALLLIGGAGLLAIHAVRRSNALPARLLAAGLCIALAVIGLEEISWGQRLFGFATPEPLAEVNWQQEFNFHNVQTDLFETVYYAGAWLFLILLPLVRDLFPAQVKTHPLISLVPQRGAALLGVPLLWFDYGHWNLFAIQLGAWLGLFALVAWALAARRRADAVEAAMFALAAAALVIGKTLFLAWGPAAVDLPDPTEYKEFFIALGFAGYAVSVARSTRN